MSKIESFAVPYTVSLIGSLKSHLKGLLGYDTMILELMQNADDAEAEKMIFDVRDECLRVTNNAEFKYCGNLQNTDCPIENKCDFHRIKEFAGAQKEKNSENIGKFGIGFASTYQITDRPKIFSHGISAEFHPETGKVKCEKLETQMTTFDLPWARDSQSELRIALGVGSVDNEKINQITTDCATVLNESLLFLRHLRRVELKRNGKASLIVKLDRKEISDKHNEVSISFEPEKRAVEKWLVFEHECPDEKVTKLKKEYSLLDLDDRNSDIQIAVRTDSTPIEKGLLYAYLPTQQSSYLPLHINADFYPDPSRKRINLSGGQHQQKWNELLIAEAAEKIAIELENMTKYIDHNYLFELFIASYNANNNKNFPFTTFWDHIEKSVIAGANVIYSSKDKYEKFDDIFFDNNLDKRKENELSTFYKIGGKLLHEDYLNNQSFHLSINVLSALGVKKLTVEKFGDIVNKSELLKSYKNEISNPSEKKIKEIFVPLWSYADALISSENPDVSSVGPIDFALTFFNSMTSIDKLYRAPTSIKNSELGKLLQWGNDEEHFNGIKFAHDGLSQFVNLYSFIESFGLNTLVANLEKNNYHNKPPEDVNELKSIYELIVDLNKDYKGYGHDSLLENLKLLQIWKTSEGFSDLKHILLPGNFDDPIGDSQMLDSRYLSSKIEKFIEEKLKVKRQNIKTYIETILPMLFEGGVWTRDNSTYHSLMLTLANEKNLLDDDQTLQLLKETPLIPNKAGDWEKPSNHIYFYQKKLAELIGNDKDLWVNEELLLKDKSIKKFFKELGISTKPSPFVLVRRMKNLSKNYPPNPEIVKKSANAFYALCELYVNNSENDYKERIHQQMVSTDVGFGGNNECFPVMNDHEKWHSIDEDEGLYEPSQYKAFEYSDAHILAFTAIEKLKDCENLMKAIGFLKVDTDKVIKHLSYCIENKKPPDNLVYKVLSDLEVSSSNMPSDGYWIYHPNEKKYIRPNQTFFKKAPINKYTYLLPDEYDDIYKASSLFEDIGVKEEPNIEDYINIILQDLVQGNNYSSTQENMSPKAVVSKKDIKIYTSCVNYIAENFDISEISENLIQNLLDEPSILTHHGKFKHFDDILIDDSKWYRGFFEAENNNLEWLTELYDIDWSAFETLGLKKLSKCVELELVDASGKLVIESDLIKIFQDRKTLFLRVIQSQPLEIRTKLSTIIEKIDINSFNELIIKAHVDNNANIQYSSEPKSEIAFFKEKENQLLLSRPIKKNNYVSFFKPILNSLLIDSDVKPTLALFDAICSKSLEDGSAYLDDLDYKDFQEIETTEELIDEELVQDEKVVELEKGKYDENGKWIGSWETNQDEKITKLEEDSQTEEGLKPNNEEKQRQEEPPSFNEYDGAEDNPESTFSENLSQGQLTEQYKEEEEEDHPQHKPEYNTDSNALNKNQNITKTNETRSSSSTSSYKSKSGDSEKINTRKSERLVTYAGRGPKDSFSEKSNKLNMEIEKKSREIVLLEEKDNGRKPKAKSQTNPGYDIYSYDEKSGEERFIEVKGTANEWDKRGVSISAKQFVFSYQQGEKSWLYVVDKVFGPSPQTYKIQNFARQVNSFMFDSGWAEKMEIHNKQSKYVVGKTIIDKDVGKGVIEDVEKKGEMRILKIKFENSGTKRKPLNIERMTIEEEK